MRYRIRFAELLLIRVEISGSCLSSSVCVKVKVSFAEEMRTVSEGRGGWEAVDSLTGGIEESGARVRKKICGEKICHHKAILSVTKVDKISITFL